MALKRISKKEAKEKYGVCVTGASSLCWFYLKNDGCVVDESGCIRYYPPEKLDSTKTLGGG